MKRVTALLLIVACNFLSCSKPAERGCGGADFVVLRMDDGNRRIFIQGDDDSVGDLDVLVARLKSVSAYIERCRPEWGDGWSASVFTEKKYASYKDDESVRAYVADGSWERSYLAEYSNRKGLLTRYPLHAERRSVVEMDLSH